MRSMINERDLIGLDGTLARAYARAEAAAACERCVSLWGEPGVGKETFASLIARSSTPRARAFAHFRSETLDDERWNALLTDPPEFLRDGLLYLSSFELAPRKFQNQLACAALSGVLRFRLVLGFAVPFRSLRAESLAPEFLDLAAGFPISLPPLRERACDVPDLARLFFKDACVRRGLWRDPLSEQELDRLASLQWRDNLDGLRRVVERVVETDVFPKDFDDDYVESPASERLVVAPASSKPSPEDQEFLTIDEAAKRHIEDALRRRRGVIEGKRGAAALLGINPHTLRARIRKLGIDTASFRQDDE